MANYGLGGESRWEYRDIIGLLYDNKWHDADNLLKMGSTVLAESGGFPKAWHWNAPSEGGNGSTDWGMFQLNDGNVGGTPPVIDINNNPIAVTDFQKKALDPVQAAEIARSLYNSRGFQPWVGFSKWLNYAPQMSRALCNWLRVKYGIPIL